MAGDGVNVPLLLRTAQTLRERFAALRPVGPVPAVMAETPPGERYPYREEGGKRLPMFESHDFEKVRWHSGAMAIRGGAHVANRDNWLASNRNAAQRLLLVCHDANGFVPMLRREFDLPTECGTGKAGLRWLWTVFELAERGIPGSLLSLAEPVFRCGPGGVVHASEDDICWAQEHPGESGFFPDLFKGEFHVARHWRLADLVEASVMVMDLVELTIETGSPVESPAPAPATVNTDAIQAAVSEGVKSALLESKKPRNPRGESTCERLRDLHENIDPEFAETVSEPRLGKRIGRSPGTFPDSEYWTTVLQPKRREVRAAIREGKKKLREAQRWGDFNSAGRKDEGFEDH